MLWIQGQYIITFYFRDIVQCPSIVSRVESAFIYVPHRFIFLTIRLQAHSVVIIMAPSQSSRLAGKNVLITGASSGIGRSTAFEFARASPDNLKLILTARRLDTLKQIASDIAKEVGGAGVKVLPVQLDVSNADEVRSFVNKLPDEFKEIDVLVNNA